MNPGELFARPLVLAALLLVPLFWALFARHDRARVRRLTALLGPRAATLAAESDPRLRRRRRLLGLAALGLGLAALAGPRFGRGPGAGDLGALDLVICLDVSRSMLARDIAPSRLERARLELEDLAARARGERLALVLFAGEAELAVPLTRDLDSLLALARQADPEILLRGGSAPGAALHLAGEVLAARPASPNGSGPPPAAVLLLADGEDETGGAAARAAELAAAGIPVHCLGLGTAGGGKIPVREDGRERFLRDPLGAEVVTRLAGADLARVAAAGGGRYLDARTSARPLVELYEDEALPAARRALQAAERARRPSRHRWPLSAAVVLWMLALCTTDRRRR